MKITNMFNKLCVGLAMICGLSFTSCEQGLTYEEAPESYYTEVSLGSPYFYLKSRELFPNMIYGVNWKQWAPNYVYTPQISWETTMAEESSQDAPDGKLYVINVKLIPRLLTRLRIRVSCSLVASSAVIMNLRTQLRLLLMVSQKLQLKKLFFL